MAIKHEIERLRGLLPAGVTLVAVSKTHPDEAIMEAYRAGQRIFGESRPQEMAAKAARLPQDVEWHLIGHLQSNKVRLVVPFATMVHSVDSPRLLEVIDREALRAGRVVDLLLEVHIAAEESKHGWPEDKLIDYISSCNWQSFKNIRIRGLMGIATNTDDCEQVRGEFTALRGLFERLQPALPDYFDVLSMGMTSDYPVAVECGATMVRIGSQIFGAR
ncbi:MAG: YggS family pyridoxal phosphate-dependent enzyme [Rikenellaceae bacterium]|jgi:pyridoxal phosphate enzyme (YggS family)|nr:YggS family pyridoxal phosphate-dependent enzyme [Rikenellaceae bacterium]